MKDTIEAVQITKEKIEVPAVHLQDLNPQFKVKLDGYVRELVRAPAFNPREPIYRAVRRCVSRPRIDPKVSNLRKKVPIDGMPISVKQAIEASRRLHIPLLEFEKHIEYIKKGASPNSTIFHSTLPITANEKWAFLIGVYHAAGGFQHRQRDWGLRFNADNGLAAALAENGRLLGEEPHVYEREGLYKHKQLGIFEHKRSVVYFSRIMQCILGHFGVEFRRVKPSIGRKIASREIAPTIPKWINARFMHAYVEGYLNTNKVATSCYRTIRRGSALPPINRRVMIRFIGIDRNATEHYAQTIVAYLRKTSIDGHFRFLRKQRCYQFEYLIHSKDSIIRLSQLFLIRQIYTKSKLAAILASMDPGNIAFRIIQNCDDRDSLVLGYLLHGSEIMENIESDVRIGRAKLVKSLEYLVSIGAVEKSEDVYRYSPERFKSLLAASLKDGAARLQSRMSELGLGLTYRCEVCKKIVLDVNHCAKPTIPVRRDQVLKAYSLKASKHLILADSLLRGA